MVENVLYSLSQIVGDPEFEGFAFVSNESLRGKPCLAFDFDPDDILMRHREQLSNQQVAEALGLSEAASSMRYLRAIRRLRAVLLPEQNSEGGLE